MCIEIIIGTWSLAPGARDLRRLSVENGEQVVLVHDYHHQVVAKVGDDGKLDIVSERLSTAIDGSFQPATWIKETGRWKFTNADNARGLNSMQARKLKSREKRKYKETLRHGTSK